MKNPFITLSLMSSILALSACAASSVQEQYEVVAQACMKAAEGREEFLVWSTQRNNPEMISASNHAMKLYSYTADGMATFMGHVGRAKDLTYVAFPHGDKQYSLFKRDFASYKINEWSAWETPDYSFKEDKKTHPFFWLSTRDKDRTNELPKVSDVQDKVKVRFKLMTYDEYRQSAEYQVINTINKMVKNDTVSCL